VTKVRYPQLVPEAGCRRRKDLKMRRALTEAHPGPTIVKLGSPSARVIDYFGLPIDRLHDRSPLFTDNRYQLYRVASVIALNTAALMPLCFSTMSVSGAVSNCDLEAFILAMIIESSNPALAILMTPSF
jgi:hypothetical protein